MNTHEFQAKKILQKYGIPVPTFFVISDLSQLHCLLQNNVIKEAVLKVQVHAGGRGKAGGVKIAKNKEEILMYATELLGKKITNEQTGPSGLVSHEILISEAVDIKKEYYLGTIIDRLSAQGVLIASPEGGVDIEDVAATHPEKVLKLPIPLSGKLKTFELWRVVQFMGWKGVVANQGMSIVAALAKAFVETDASLLEINPLVETKAGQLIALDAKLSVDENALWRQPEIKSFYDSKQLSPGEAKAQAHELSYISLDGNIGCMVNGAGLAMATMDIINYYGGSPANFLDVGGGASKEKISEGFKIILSDPKVKAILINIFGGIMNCETLASGLIAVTNELHIRVPLVVRLEGTNVEQGKKLINAAGLNILIADSLAQAAQKSVEVANVNSSK